ncbi:hypothetical protein [Streptomyces noursei]|uniref:hypothetical protein n=1 Tax=Streptomyces noursei TaxID=1971 RepID=UPI0030F1F5B8
MRDAQVGVDRWIREGGLLAGEDQAVDDVGVDAALDDQCPLECVRIGISDTVPVGLGDIRTLSEA